MLATEKVGQQSNWFCVGNNGDTLYCGTQWHINCCEFFRGSCFVDEIIEIRVDHPQHVCVPSIVPTSLSIDSITTYSGPCIEDNSIEIVNTVGCSSTVITVTLFRSPNVRSSHNLLSPHDKMCFSQ